MLTRSHSEPFLQIDQVVDARFSLIINNAFVYLILQMGALMFHNLCIFHNNNTCQLPRRSIYFTLMDIKMKYFPPCEFYCFFSAKQFLPKFSLMHHTHLIVLKKYFFLPELLFFTSTLLNIYTCLFCFYIRLINADVL